jgi:serine/threonine protein kinase
MQHLQPNTTLQGGKYRIERVLGQGGFGITYLARNTVFDIDVAIKEFFMKDENGRNGSSITMPNITKQDLFHGQRNHGVGESDHFSSISRIPNKDYSVVKTLGPDPSSSTVDFFVVLGGRFCQMKVARRLFLRTFEHPYYLDVTSDKKR